MKTQTAKSVQANVNNIVTEMFKKIYNHSHNCTIQTDSSTCTVFAKIIIT